VQINDSEVVTELFLLLLLLSAHSSPSPVAVRLLQAGRMYVGRDESVAYCMAVPEAPPISEHTRKFTTLAEAGTRVRHVGFRRCVSDYAKVKYTQSNLARGNEFPALTG
jgi:hypothetical protein